MGKWHAVEGREHPECGGKRFWSVSEADGSRLIFITKDEQIADQVVREHNSHEAMVKLIKDLRDDPCGPAVDRDAWLLRIDAVLAQAEGRE